jgi:hypothetical protein
LQCAFFSEDGENLGVCVGELVFRHSEIYENKFVFGFEKWIKATLIPRQIQQLNDRGKIQKSLTSFRKPPLYPFELRGRAISLCRRAHFH